MAKNKRLKNKETTAKLKAKKNIHHWRLCPAGEHWVRTHQMKIKPSKKNPSGRVTTRQGHCRLNPTHRDQLYPSEIQEMSSVFPSLKNKPCPLPLNFSNGSKYDDLIAGWTQYWNDVLKPSPLLSPNLVKALIASESAFNQKILANKKNSNSARGLMQITNETRKILGDEKGELRDHYLTLTKKDLNDPSNNICAGIRWLHRKREIASSLLGKKATWYEAVAEFKGTRTESKQRAKVLMDRFNSYLERYEKCGK